jgi:hypothetical protein
MQFHKGNFGTASIRESVQSSQTSGVLLLVGSEEHQQPVSNFPNESFKTLGGMPRGVLQAAIQLSASVTLPIFLDKSIGLWFQYGTAGNVFGVF